MEWYPPIYLLKIDKWYHNFKIYAGIDVITITARYFPVSKVFKLFCSLILNDVKSLISFNIYIFYCIVCIGSDHVQIFLWSRNFTSLKIRLFLSFGYVKSVFSSKFLPKFLIENYSQIIVLHGSGQFNFYFKNILFRK